MTVRRMLMGAAVALLVTSGTAVAASAQEAPVWVTEQECVDGGGGPVKLPLFPDLTVCVGGTHNEALVRGATPQPTGGGQAAPAN
ncbi:hypothetical protein [Amycolatopsis magusensis]|uniref:Secreted protein n=1 Tax=Amycolatopsis magusensis TaxID=882444 RepID=A0ABS4PXY7_9PSEU|nr:hypothetical protein [Amycolatopsis magusensis]MBP2184293.1 hypothetical protein [Amycolatopsis magusensis]